MSLRACLLALALSVSGVAAHAEDLDMTKIACKDFIAAPKDHVAIILAWLEGYYTKQSDPPIIFTDKMTKDAKNLGAYCSAHGDDDIIKAAEAVMDTD